jgi:hypothetical protein
MLPIALAVLAPAAAASAPGRPVVVVFGDSLVEEAASYVRFFGGLSGLDVRVRASGGSALCDYQAEVEAAVADPEVAAVAVAFTGNNLTPCAQGLEGAPLGQRYADDVASVMAASRAATPVLWIRGPAAWYPNPNGILVARRTGEAASRWRNAELVDGATAISPAGVWSRTQPCLASEPCTGPVVTGVRTNVVRAPDGIHFCPTGKPSVAGRTVPCDTYASGARRYAVAIIEHLRRAIGR